jgi:DNA-binding NtrC family response regulator
LSKIRVLLVDDEKDYVKAMAERMEMRDVSSRVAFSGDEALRMVEDEAPDVMVLDLRMPGIDGMEVLERVKREHPNVQVIILSGHGSEKEEAEARRLGAFDYLKKPMDTGDVLKTVRAAWKKGLKFLKDSKDEFDRSMTAAALAEGGAADMAREAMREPRREEVEELPAPAPPPQAPDTSGRGLNVLFVDDEEDFVRTMAERMEMREVGSEVALDGTQALRMLEDEIPDVMVLDLRMPGLDGMEVLRRVKNTYPQIEVIIMTGHGSDSDEKEARSLGAFDYLRKPVDINDLMEVIRRAGEARRRSE